MARKETRIKLELTGSRAAHGISLTDLEGFIESFVRALRDYERSRRNAPDGEIRPPGTQRCSGNRLSPDAA